MDLRHMIAALPQPIVGGELVRLQTRQHVVALTFDGVPGEIVMMHLGSSRDGSAIDAHALPAVIRALRARGYRFVTLAGVRASPG